MCISEYQNWALEKPFRGEVWCKKNRHTYSVWLSVPIVIEHELGQKKRSRVRLGKIPMMDSKGGFLINGVPRSSCPPSITSSRGLFSKPMGRQETKEKETKKMLFSDSDF